MFVGNTRALDKQSLEAVCRRVELAVFDLGSIASFISKELFATDGGLVKPLLPVRQSGRSGWSGQGGRGIRSERRGEECVVTRSVGRGGALLQRCLDTSNVGVEGSSRLDKGGENTLFCCAQVWTGRGGGLRGGKTARSYLGHLLCNGKELSTETVMAVKEGGVGRK